MTTNMSAKVINYFGFNSVHPFLLKSSLISPIILIGEDQHDDLQKAKKIKDYMINLFNGKYDDNHLCVQSILKYLMFTNRNILEETVIGAFDDITKLIKTDIDNFMRDPFHTNIDETLGFLLTTYYRFKNVIKKISSRLYTFESYFKKYKNDGKKITFIGTMSIMFFIKNVIAQKYTVNEQTLINIISKNIVITKSNIKNIIQLYKLYDFINRFSHVVENNRIDLYGQDIDDYISIPKLNDQTTTENIINIINNEFNSITERQDKKLKEEDIDMFNKISTMVEYISKDSPQFMTSYKTKLTTRLLSSQYFKELLDLEKNIILKINKHDDNDYKLCYKMLCQIDDIIHSMKLDHIFKTKTVLANDMSPKYAKLDRSKVDINKCTFNVIRNFAWFADVCETPYNLPIDLNVYTDMFKAYYKSQYPLRQIQYLFDQSEGVMALTVNSGKYNIKMTLSQMSVLQEIYDKKAIDAKTLCDTINISCEDITRVLNSLLLTKIICREIGDDTNLLLKYSINEDFSFREQDISIIGVLNMTQLLDDDQVCDVLDIIKKISPCKYDTIQTDCQKELGISDMNILKKIVDYLISKKAISFNDEIYTFLNDPFNEQINESTDVIDSEHVNVINNDQQVKVV